jgi:hypothetical protein
MEEPELVLKVMVLKVLKSSSGTQIKQTYSTLLGTRTGTGIGIGIGCPHTVEVKIMVMVMVKMTMELIWTLEQNHE